MKSKQELQREAVNAIMKGELLLEEAMVRYNVKDKRTISAWIKKNAPLLKAAEAQELYKTEFHQHLLRENILLEKVIELQHKICKLEEKNTQLTRHRDLLMEKVSSLELRVQIQQKGAK